MTVGAVDVRLIDRVDEHVGTVLTIGQHAVHEKADLIRPKRP